MSTQRMVHRIADVPVGFLKVLRGNLDGEIDYCCFMGPYTLVLKESWMPNPGPTRDMVLGYVVYVGSWADKEEQYNLNRLSQETLSLENAAQLAWDWYCSNVLVDKIVLTNENVAGEDERLGKKTSST